MQESNISTIIWNHLIDGDRASVYTLAAYIQEEWTARENLVLTAGVRGTQHKETGLNFSPKISGLYKPGEHINLRASYALGYKAPTIKELYYNYTGVIGGFDCISWQHRSKSTNLTICFNRYRVRRAKIPSQFNRIHELSSQHD